MQEMTIKLTIQQAVPVMMAITNQMNNSRNMRLSLAAGGSKERQDILDSEIQSLAEAYKAIQEAL